MWPRYEEKAAVALISVIEYLVDASLLQIFILLLRQVCNPSITARLVSSGYQTLKDILYGVCAIWMLKYVQYFNLQ